MKPGDPYRQVDYGYGSAPARRSGFGPGLLIGLLAVSLLVLLVRTISSVTGSGFDPDAVARPITPRGDLAQDEQATIELFQAASPSVVHITRVRSSGSLFSLREVADGTGSGFVWDGGGHVVTNFHVIQGAEELRVTLADRSSWRARLVGYEPDYDLAVVRIDAPAERLRPLPVGTSDDLLVGQKVFAIGNPFGLDQTLTTGVISGLGREILSVTERPISDVIQTDAAINPGNSGGPLLDSSGRLIGVNTAIYTQSGTSAGVGFAVPVDTVNRVVPHLLRSGRVVRPGLGVLIVPDQTARSLGVEGVVISSVLPGSAAERAGMRPATRNALGEIDLGDVIVGMDGRRIQRQDDLFAILEEHEAGDRVPVRLLRGGSEVEIEVQLQSLR